MATRAPALAKGFPKDGHVSRGPNRFRSAKPAGVKNSRKTQEILEARDLTGEVPSGGPVGCRSARAPDMRS
ncbi:hypothetical protein ACFVZR_25055 [Streptomyces sp. NPDC058316]|uniref:hypothetical protein n=1 Tax=unclassified Streptomyces TaxID=2593676 RepID=UPI0033248D6F